MFFCSSPSIPSASRVSTLVIDIPSFPYIPSFLKQSPSLFQKTFSKWPFFFFMCLPLRLTGGFMSLGMFFLSIQKRVTKQIHNFFKCIHFLKNMVFKKSTFHKVKLDR